MTLEVWILALKTVLGYLLIDEELNSVVIFDNVNASAGVRIMEPCAGRGQVVWRQGAKIVRARDLDDSELV